jgi:predicted ATP-grasp superfamily ATP-dependent carboligase
MTNKINVLVFPCGSEIGLEIHNSLKWSTHINLFGASSVHSNHGRFVYKNYYEELPFITDSNFIKEINQIIVKYKINFLYPANDDTILFLSENREKIKCSLILPNKESCLITRSKLKTYNFFKDKLKTPKVFQSTKLRISDFPVFVKPNIGQGSKGATIVNSKNELDFLINKNPDLVVMEYLPGKEYTIDCFTNKQGELLFSEGRERIRISNGVSVNTMPTKNKEFRKMAKIINNKLNLRGGWFFQVKKDINNILTLLEIAPRIAGTMSLHRNMGVNLPLLSIFDFSNIDTKIIPNKEFLIEEDRALFNRFIINLSYITVYIDLDDTIIFNKKINPFIIHFIFQEISKKHKIVLITKHKQKLKSTLKKNRIESLFDKIIILNKEDKKSDFISSKKSIFIDDSFEERKQILKKCNIPVFDTNSIECLIDYKF